MSKFAFLILCLVYALTTACGNPASPGSGAAIEFVEDRGTYLIFNDTPDGLVEAGLAQNGSGTAFYSAIEKGFLKVHPDNSHFVLVLTDFPNSGCCTYRPLSNDVTGIGLAHRGEVEVRSFNPNEAIFDRSVISDLQGVVSLGQWGAFFIGNTGQLNERLLSLALGHELSHAWLAFPWYRGKAGEVQSDVLGVEGAHWSFYLSSKMSPMEGLDWQENNNGTFAASAKRHEVYTYRFNDLELYLMGLLPAADVEPVYIIDDPQDCTIDGIKAACPDPATRSLGWGTNIILRGEKRMITVADFVDIEGQRSPAFGQAGKDLEVSFILIKRPGAQLENFEKLRIETLVSVAIESWGKMTASKSRLVNASGID